MKKVGLLVLVVFTSLSIFSQDEEPKKEKNTNTKRHEVRIIMENFLANKSQELDNPTIWYSSNFSNSGSYEFYNNKFKYGLGYNFNMSKIGIRTRFFYNSYDDISFDIYNTVNSIIPVDDDFEGITNDLGPKGSVSFNIHF